MGERERQSEHPSPSTADQLLNLDAIALSRTPTRCLAGGAVAAADALNGIFSRLNKSVSTEEQRLERQATQYTFLSDFVTEIANSFIPCHSVADPSVRPQRQLFRRLLHLVTLVTSAGVGCALEVLELRFRCGCQEPVVL
uniref:Uncharacterized protein n=1 Tax=Oryza nivara TaxID=4536 RepID=A0A0E0J9E3_ORYNI